MRCAALQKNYLGYLIYTDRNPGNMCGNEYILRVWDNGGGNIKLAQAEFIHMGSLNRDSAA